MSSRLSVMEWLPANSGDYTVRRNHESRCAVAGSALGFPPGRALPAVGHDNENLASAAGGHRVQGRPERAGPGPQDVCYVGGEYVLPQIKGGGHDGGALLFGVGRGGARKYDAVDVVSVTTRETVYSRRDRHGHAVLVRSWRPPAPRGNSSRRFPPPNGSGVRMRRRQQFPAKVPAPGCKLVYSGCYQRSRKGVNAPSRSGNYSARQPSLHSGRPPGCGHSEGISSG